jgi:hypothetical protein
MGKFRVLAGNFEEDVRGRLRHTFSQGQTIELFYNSRGKGKLFGGKWLTYPFESEVVELSPNLGDERGQAAA